MSIWVFLFGFRTVIAPLNVQEIAENLLQTKRLVLPETDSVSAIISEEISATTEAILIRYLQISLDPVFVLLDEDIYDPTKIKNSILFIDGISMEDRLVTSSNQRNLIVTTTTLFPAVLEECVAVHYFNLVYVVYNATSSSVYHYDRFQKKLSHWDTLPFDPLLRATDDLAGFSFSSKFTRPSDVHFVLTISTRLNGSCSSNEPSDIMISSPVHILFLFYQPDYGKIYMHRTQADRVLVPRLNKPIPTVYVLTDPFDAYSWLLILSTIIALALLRTFLTKRPTPHSLISNFINIARSFTAGTKLQPFHQDVERQLFGLVLLLYVVLINCYQSLVISYLLSPRFYPELDTFRLLNESCCWVGYSEVMQYDFRQNGECSETQFVSALINGNLQSEDARVAHEMSLCVPVDVITMSLILNGTNSNRAPGFGLFRWSKRELNEIPLMALIWADPVVRERVELIGGVYFGEGALFRRFEERDEDHWDGNGGPKRCKLEDLSLVWMVHAVGMTCGLVVFCAEVAIARLR